MKEITFKVNTDEANLILEGLGHIPFARVYELVAKIQTQAQEQLNGNGPSRPKSDSENPAVTIEN